MGLFDVLKKKKVAKPVQDLETPPMPEAAGMQEPMQPAPGFEDFTPVSQQQRIMPQFQPSIPSFAPEAQIPQRATPTADMNNAQYGEVPEEMPVPFPSEEFQAPEQQSLTQIPPEMHQEQQQVPQVTVFNNPPEIREPQFKFYYGPEKTEQKEAHETAELPFDVTQELLHMPEMHQEEHQEIHPEEEYEKPYTFMSKEQAAVIAPVKKEGVHVSKQFITIAALYEVGEQLVNMGEDLGLAKDTVFRLTDLNEQEIEQMVKWQNVQQSMELRIAEIDKLLFKV